ncbi:MAG: hypothetical protein WD022_03855 [Balneolaceae bacterium]
MKTGILIFSFALAALSAQAQGQLIGSCEGCEAVFEYGDRELTSVDTLPGFHENEPKIKISGTIYKPDGKTPAEGVILYVYHTNREGEYATLGNETGWARRHGYIRTWLKTGADGRYTFYTNQPGTYSRNAAHIHPIILEPNGNYYWLGSYLFEGDPNLSRRQLNQQNPRGGSDGILKLQKKGTLLIGERDIILGRNVSGYK